VKLPFSFPSKAFRHGAQCFPSALHWEGPGATYGYYEQNYGLVNEVGLAIAESSVSSGAHGMLRPGGHSEASDEENPFFFFFFFVAGQTPPL